MWTQAEAVALCRHVEPVVERFGCHVALTGGSLYKDGPRKDCDLIIYRHGLSHGETRGPFLETVNRGALLVALEDIDLYVTKTFVRVVKCLHGDDNRPVDLIFPECESEGMPGDQGTSE